MSLVSEAPMIILKTRVLMLLVRRTVLFMVLLLLAACPSQSDLEAARNKGRLEGLKDGKAAGWAETFEEERSRAYAAAVRRVREEGAHRYLSQLYLVAVFMGACLGFCLQYAVTYLLRRRGDLTIDNRSIPAVRVLAALLLFTLSSCGDEVAEAREQGYRAAFAEGQRSGRLQGKEEGSAQGRLTGEEDAKNGAAWALYVEPALLALLLGAAGGVVAQILALNHVRRTDRLPPAVAVALIPAMKQSALYAHLLRKADIIRSHDEEVERVRAQQRLTERRIEAQKEGELKRIRAARTVHDIALDRIPQVFLSEIDDMLALDFAEIVCANKRCRQKLFVKVKADGCNDAVRRCRCPKCHQVVRFRLSDTSLSGRDFSRSISSDE